MGINQLLNQAVHKKEIHKNNHVLKIWIEIESEPVWRSLHDREWTATTKKERG